MTPIPDAEAIIPIQRPARCTELDRERPKVTFTSMLQIPGNQVGSVTEKKTKFAVPIFSNGIDEDVECLIATTQAFSVYAATEGLWDVPMATPTPLLFLEFPKCLTGSALALI